MMSKGDKLYHDHICAAVLNNPSTSKFTRDIIRAALKRDPVDVANELQVLADLFKDRAASYDGLGLGSIDDWQDNGGEG